MAVSKSDGSEAHFTTEGNPIWETEVVDPLAPLDNPALSRVGPPLASARSVSQRAGPVGPLVARRGPGGGRNSLQIGDPP